MKNLWIGFLLTFAVSTAFVANNREDISWMNGSWKGLGYQPNITMPWEIELACKAAKKEFIIRYPTLNCQGYWKISKIEANRIIFQEKIAKGEHDCIPSGKVIVTRVDDKHISYSYFEAIDGKEVLNSFSTLIKQ